MTYKVELSIHVKERIEERNLTVVPRALEMILTNNLKKVHLTSKEVQIHFSNRRMTVVVSKESSNLFVVKTVFLLDTNNTAEKQASKKGAYLIKL